MLSPSRLIPIFLTDSSPVWLGTRQEDTSFSSRSVSRPPQRASSGEPVRLRPAIEVMKDVVGSPGTRSGLALRLSQSLCAGASMVTLAAAGGSEFATAYPYLGVSMELQCFWGLFLACVDVHSLRTNKDLHTPYHVWQILIGDWIIGVNSFAAVFAATGVTVYYERDAQFCRAYPALACDQIGLSVVLASMAWSFLAASATSLFWLMASFY